jgi:hypothetical protein
MISGFLFMSSADENCAQSNLCFLRRFIFERHGRQAASADRGFRDDKFRRRLFSGCTTELGLPLRGAAPHPAPAAGLNTDAGLRPAKMKRLGLPSWDAAPHPVPAAGFKDMRACGPQDDKARDFFWSLSCGPQARVPLKLAAGAGCGAAPRKGRQ